MNAGLLWKDRRLLSEPDTMEEERFRDLKLEAVVDAMGDGNPEIAAICHRVLDVPLQTREEILYRQEILRECIRKPGVIETAYRICVEAEEKRKNTWCRLTSPHLTTVYSSAADLLKIYLESLVKIRREFESAGFCSGGLRQLSDRLSRELSDAYIDQIRSLRDGIESRDGTLISAGFGAFLQGVSYVQRQPVKGFAKFRWVLQPSFTLGERDMQGAKDLEYRKDRAINEVANVMAQAAESLQFLTDQLREELAFYLGGIHLWRQMECCHGQLCYPELTEEKDRSYKGLYDGTLALNHMEITGNSIRGQNRRLWLITGANQGGKTTFLRSVGLCQLMAQCGLFVFAEGCRIPIRRQIFTHFGREEDRSLNNGRLEEELSRMSEIVDRIQPGAMLLSNESFSSTNDRDGSEIFLGIVRGLMDREIEVFAVTHLIDFARIIARRQDVLSLRPERTEAGERTYRLREEEPRPDAYAEDIYRAVFHVPQASASEMEA